MTDGAMVTLWSATRDAPVLCPCCTSCMWLVAPVVPDRYACACCLQEMTWWETA